MERDWAGRVPSDRTWRNDGDRPHIRNLNVNLYTYSQWGPPQSLVCRPAVAYGSLVEMSNLESHPRSTESESAWIILSGLLAQM